MASTTGTIKRKTDKGFGFIAAADGTDRGIFFTSRAASRPASISCVKDSASHSRSVKVRKARERKT